jgi:2-amino-4-hydroxy-6-hydroxymethyldihydropteridine diphosphokinase
MKELVLGLGSNLGDRSGNLQTAIDLIGERIGRVDAVSTFLETVPWGFSSDHQFLNCVIKVEPDPEFLLLDFEGAGEIIHVIQSIEKEMGRMRTDTYTDREIDIDILFFGDMVLDLPGLQIPHPLIGDRDFVLASLLEICPDRIHPVSGKTVRELWETLHLLPDT